MWVGFQTIGRLTREHQGYRRLLPSAITSHDLLLSVSYPTPPSTNPKYHNAKVDAGDEDVDGEELMQRFRREVARDGVIWRGSGGGGGGTRTPGTSASARLQPG